MFSDNKKNGDVIPSDWWISRDQQVSINVLTFAGLMIADFFDFFFLHRIYLHGNS